MATTKVKIKTHENHISVIPIVIPNLDEVRKFAAKLHAEGMPWEGRCLAGKRSIILNGQSRRLILRWLSHLRISALARVAFGSSRSCGSMAKTLSQKSF